MGLYDPQMRVSTSGPQPALGRNYATNAATAGRVLTSQGDDLPPLWGVPSSVVPINQTLVVDAANGVAAATGTWSAPFLTAQAAINYAVLQGWSNVQLLLAPGTYAGNIAIPIALSTTLSGYDASGNNSPVVSGNISFTGAGFATLNATNLFISSPSIAVGTESLSARFVNCEIAADITGTLLDIEWIESLQTGEVTATGILNTYWDGWSWSQTLGSAPAFLDDAGYSREFRDAGHDVFDANLTVNGVAIGATQFVNVALLPYVRADDRIDVQVADPAVQDFLCGVHGVGAGSVTLWITNLSRVSTNFDEPVLLLIHHNTMASEPIP